MRARRQRALAAAVALLAVAAAGPQDAKPEQATAAPQAKQDEPTASAILARAIEAQGLPPVKDAAADLPLALRAKVNLRYRDQKGNAISVDAERKFLGSKDGTNRIWTRITPTSAKERETILAFDGKQPWFWSKERGLRLLTEPGMEHDRTVLEEDLESTELLTRAFLLRNLPSQLGDLKRRDDVTHEDPKSKEKKTAWVIEGTSEVVRGGVKRKAVIWLYVEQKSSWLYGARVMIDGDPALQICLWNHEKRKGVVVPGTIELYWDDEKEPRQTLYVEELELAPKLEPGEFEPPRAQ